MITITIQDLEKTAESRGGQCLAVDYKSMESPILWECTAGHRWYDSPQEVIAHLRWCPECARLKVDWMRRVKAFAAQKGGKCLSNFYVNAHTKLLWECDKGHQWEAKPSDVIHNNTWCPICASKSKYTIDDMKAFAAKKGGKCLSDEYRRTDIKLLWECAQGHQWRAPAQSLINKGSWCPTCSRNKRTRHGGWSIEAMQDIARERGGRCLSMVFRNLKTKLQWECREGHQWEASPTNIITRNSWCPHCARKSRVTIEDMKRIAGERGGKCLSEVFVNNRTKLLWECRLGHQWQATPHSITVNGSWCPQCARKITIEDMREYAEKKGGKCLSDVYVNSTSKLLWQCENEHIWLATPRSVTYRGKWCPFCALM